MRRFDEKGKTKHVRKSACYSLQTIFILIHIINQGEEKSISQTNRQEIKSSDGSMTMVRSSLAAGLVGSNQEELKFQPALISSIQTRSSSIPSQSSSSILLSTGLGGSEPDKLLGSRNLTPVDMMVIQCDVSVQPFYIDNHINFFTVLQVSPVESISRQRFSIADMDVATSLQRLHRLLLPF